jgi:hypothetical protein
LGFGQPGGQQAKGRDDWQVETIADRDHGVGGPAGGQGQTWVKFDQRGVIDDKVGAEVAEAIDLVDNLLQGGRPDSDLDDFIATDVERLSFQTLDHHSG